MILRTFEEYKVLFDKSIEVMLKSGRSDRTKIYISNRKCTAVVKRKLTPVVVAYYPYEHRVWLLVPSKRLTGDDISLGYHNEDMIREIQNKSGYKYLFKYANLDSHDNCYENDEGDPYESEQECCEAQFSGDWVKFIKSCGRVDITVHNKYNKYSPTLGFKMY